VSVTTIFLKIGIPNLEYLLFNFFCIPIFGAMIFFGSAMNFEFLCGKAKKILEYLSRISYEFFLAQFFTFDIFKFIQKNVQAEFSSFMRFLISFSTCILISILMHEFFSMPLKKLLNSSFKKRKN
jgi:peptidoglycan/LPS O-acetylase OafA/YrhL